MAHNVRMDIKIWLGIAVIVMFMGMSYAGSRTPFVLVPAGVMFYMLLTFRRETMIAAVGMILFVAAFSMKSTFLLHWKNS